MNIEQIALEAWNSATDEQNNGIDPILIEFLRRCLSKLEQQDLEPVGYFFQHEDTGRMMSVDVQQVEWGFEKNNPRLINCGKLYTETQHIAAQQKAAEACAKAVLNECLVDNTGHPCDETYNEAVKHCADAIRNNWREYL